MKYMKFAPIAALSLLLVACGDENVEETESTEEETEQTEQAETQEEETESENVSLEGVNQSTTIDKARAEKLGLNTGAFNGQDTIELDPVNERQELLLDEAVQRENWGFIIRSLGFGEETDTARELIVGLEFINATDEEISLPVTHMMTHLQSGTLMSRANDDLGRHDLGEIVLESTPNRTSTHTAELSFTLDKFTSSELDITPPADEQAEYIRIALPQDENVDMPNDEPQYVMIPIPVIPVS